MMDRRQKIFIGIVIIGIIVIIGLIIWFIIEDPDVVDRYPDKVETVTTTR